MRTTVVPAQVTTVEDKIAGNLNFTQLLLMTTPVFLSGAIFAFLPPFMNLAVYKLAICGILASACLFLALRIKGEIMLSWISLIARYNLRPRYYLYNKNDVYLRKEVEQTKETETKPSKKELPVADTLKDIPVPLLVRLEHAVSDPGSKFHLQQTKKGALGVYIQENK